LHAYKRRNEEVIKDVPAGYFVGGEGVVVRQQAQHSRTKEETVQRHVFVPTHTPVCQKKKKKYEH
jgi:hypothetical protein